MGGQARVMLDFMTALWKMSVIDIEWTLRQACHKVLHDKSVSKEAITARATAMAAVGKLFLETRCNNDDIAAGAPRKSWKEQLAEQVGVRKDGEAQAAEINTDGEASEAEGTGKATPASEAQT